MPPFISRPNGKADKGGTLGRANVHVESCNVNFSIPSKLKI